MITPDQVQKDNRQTIFVVALVLIVISVLPCLFLIQRITTLLH